MNEYKVDCVFKWLLSPIRLKQQLAIHTQQQHKIYIRSSRKSNAEFVVVCSKRNAEEIEMKTGSEKI